MLGRSSPLTLNLVLMFFLTACSISKSASELPKETPLPKVIINTQSGNQFEFKVELAKTAHEHAVGLMHRQNLPSDQGMLFIFHDEALRSFWMKNTLISLDMLFIAASGQIVGIVHEAEPLTLDSRSVKAKSRYVLEINGGLCQKLGIAKGDFVVLKESTLL